MDTVKISNKCQVDVAKVPTTSIYIFHTQSTIKIFSVALYNELLKIGIEVFDRLGSLVIV